MDYHDNDSRSHRIVNILEWTTYKTTTDISTAVLPKGRPSFGKVIRRSAVSIIKEPDLFNIV